jgi:tRNA (mo5U34)-methyltransferase
LVCACCGGSDFAQQPVLWPELVAEWRLTPDEAEYIDRREGLRCTACQSSLRSMALARAVVGLHQGSGTLADFMSGAGAHLRILEVNEAGTLTQFLSRSSGHRLVRFPEVDVHSLPFGEGSFDLVVHAETLEHVAQPVRALAECRRVLVAGGGCAFTVPMVIGRLTMSRAGMPPSFHNNAQERDPALMVRTEYGADAWRQLVDAGFAECRLVAFDPPGGIALVGIRGVEDLPASRPGRVEVSEDDVLRRKWFYRFTLPSGARTESVLPPEVLPIHDTRERMLLQVLEPVFAKRWAETQCIDVACHEGYYGALLAQRGCKRVLGVDTRIENLISAKLMRDALRLSNLSFIQADVTAMDPSHFGQFDIVLMFGLLYHLENPVGALRVARALCREIVLLETQLSPSLSGDLEWGTASSRKRIFGTMAMIDELDEVRAANLEANTVPISLVPDLEGLLWALRMVGFSRAELVPPPRDGYEQLVRGQRAMVAAWA